MPSDKPAPIEHTHADGITHTHHLFDDPPDDVHTASVGRDHGPVDRDAAPRVEAPPLPQPAGPADEAAAWRATPADKRVAYIRDQHAARTRASAEHVARMRRATGAVLGTAKGLAPATGLITASAVTIDATSEWPVIVDGVPIPWHLDEDVHVDASSATDGLARIWVGLLTESVDVVSMPLVRPKWRTERAAATERILELARERDILHALLNDERENHDDTINRLTRARRRLARVHAAATRYRVEVEEARHAAKRAEVALANTAGDQAQLALAIIETGAATNLTPGPITEQATNVIRSLAHRLALLRAVTESNRETARAHTLTAEAAVDRLATYILENIPGEPSGPDSACDTAIRLLEKAEARAQVMADTIAANNAYSTELERRIARLRLNSPETPTNEDAVVRTDAPAPDLDDDPAGTAIPSVAETIAATLSTIAQPPTVADALEAARANAQAELDDRARRRVDSPEGP